jgi:uncharacterized protein GlcG (DUF336 family)
MQFTRFVILAAAISAFSSGAFAQSASAPKVITLELAQTMAQEAITTCRGNGYKVTALVVDMLNMPKALLRDDGAAPSTTEIAKMKAYSTLMFNRPSGPFQPLPPGTIAPPSTVPGTINAQGGLPIKVGDLTIGAIAVSGAPGGDKDAVCASAALAKVADKLK